MTESAAVRSARTGEPTHAVLGLSAYVEAAVQRQIERDQLDELITANEDLHGPLAQEEIDAAEREVFGGDQSGRTVT